MVSQRSGHAYSLAAQQDPGSWTLNSSSLAPDGAAERRAAAVRRRGGRQRPGRERRGAHVRRLRLLRRLRGGRRLRPGGCPRRGLRSNMSEIRVRDKVRVRVRVRSGTVSDLNVMSDQTA